MDETLKNLMEVAIRPPRSVGKISVWLDVTQDVETNKIIICDVIESILKEERSRMEGEKIG